MKLGKELKVDLGGMESGDEVIKNTLYVWNFQRIKVIL